MEVGCGGAGGTAPVVAECGGSWLGCPAPPHVFVVWRLDYTQHTTCSTMNCDLSLTGEGKYQLGESTATFLFFLTLYISVIFFSPLSEAFIHAYTSGYIPLAISCDRLGNI